MMYKRTLESWISLGEEIARLENKGIAGGKPVEPLKKRIQLLEEKRRFIEDSIYVENYI